MPFTCAWMMPRHRFQEVSAGIVLDFNDRSQVVGIEVLDLKKRFPNADPRTIRLDMA